MKKYLTSLKYKFSTLFTPPVNIHALPKDILLNIFMYLDGPMELEKASHVSKFLRQVSSDHLLWKKFGAPTKIAYTQFAKTLNNRITITMLGWSLANFRIYLGLRCLIT